MMMGHSVSTLNEYKLRWMARTSRGAVPATAAGVLGECAAAAGVRAVSAASEPGTGPDCSVGH